MESNIVVISHQRLWWVLASGIWHRAIWHSLMFWRNTLSWAVGHQEAEPCLLVNFASLHGNLSQKMVLVNNVILGSDRIVARTAKHSTAIQRTSQEASRGSTGSGQDIHAVWITRLHWLATTTGVSSQPFSVRH